MWYILLRHPTNKDESLLNINRARCNHACNHQPRLCRSRYYKRIYRGHHIIYRSWMNHASCYDWTKQTQSQKLSYRYPDGVTISKKPHVSGFLNNKIKVWGTIEPCTCPLPAQESPDGEKYKQAETCFTDLCLHELSSPILQSAAPLTITSVIKNRPHDRGLCVTKVWHYAAFFDFFG